MGGELRLDQINTTRYNPDYLPGALHTEHSCHRRCRGVHQRIHGAAGSARADHAGQFERWGSLLPAEGDLVSLAKGIELGTLMRMSRSSSR